MVQDYERCCSTIGMISCALCCHEMDAKRANIHREHRASWLVLASPCTRYASNSTTVCCFKHCGGLSWSSSKRRLISAVVQWQPEFRRGKTSLTRKRYWGGLYGLHFAIHCFRLLADYLVIFPLVLTGCLACSNTTRASLCIWCCCISSRLA